MLTALPRVVPFGSDAWATPGVELATAFNTANGLSVSWDFPSGIVFPKIDGDLLAVIEKAAAQEGAVSAPTTQVAPEPAAQQRELIGWVKSSEIDYAKRMGGSINLWLNKYDCDTPLYTHPVVPAAQGDVLDAERKLHSAKGSRLVRALLNESPGSLNNTDLADWIQYAQQLLTAR